MKFFEFLKNLFKREKKEKTNQLKFHYKGADVFFDGRGVKVLSEEELSPDMVIEIMEELDKRIGD